MSGPRLRIVCLGGGPAGLYFSILAKKADPDWEITVVERNRPNDTFGWGVVFSDRPWTASRNPTERATPRSRVRFGIGMTLTCISKGAPSHQVGTASAASPGSRSSGSCRSAPPGWA